ncbi:MAG: prevent-host-death protein [Salinisphaeraceae bacterium]|nr:prevent-host-death protein [Salinisphaeraceae bacterium]
MNTWSVQDAKARFSELLQASVKQGPQMVTKHGAEAAVLVPAQEWRRLTAQARPGLKSVLLACEARADLPLPERGKLRRRRPIESD